MYECHLIKLPNDESGFKILCVCVSLSMSIALHSRNGGEGEIPGGRTIFPTPFSPPGNFTLTGGEFGSST